LKEKGQQVWKGGTKPKASVQTGGGIDKASGSNLQQKKTKPEKGKSFSSHPADFQMRGGDRREGKKGAANEQKPGGREEPSHQRVEGNGREEK